MENSYQTDKVVGILVIIFSVCTALLGLLAVLGGGILSAAGAAGATQQQEGAAAAAAVGGIAMVMGLVLAAVGAIQIYGGIKILQGLRIGFMITMILSIIGIVLNLISFNVMAIIFVAIRAALAYYCWARMNGKIGPALAG